jgi:hypothetical protein
MIYFDSIAESLDGKGWCLESSDSEMTVRYGTLAGALAYAYTEKTWLEHNNKERTPS